VHKLHIVQLVPLPPNCLCFSKIHNGLSFSYRFTQVVLEKRPLNGCYQQFNLKVMWLFLDMLALFVVEGVLDMETKQVVTKRRIR